MEGGYAETKADWASSDYERELAEVTMQGEADKEPKQAAVSSLVSVEFEDETLARFGHVESVSTHYRDLLRDGPAEEASWYAGAQGQAGEVVSIETAAMKRSRDFLLMLAVEMASKRGRRIYRKAFVNWRVHVFRYIFLREQIVQTYKLHTYLARRFYAWRLVARRQVALDLCIRQCWRRRRLHRFMWWKYATRWKALKLRLTLRVMRVLKANVRLQFAVGNKWKAVGRHKQQDWAARKIQVMQRWHAPRRVFWARRMIKLWMLQWVAATAASVPAASCWSYQLIRKRRGEEQRRAAYEQETTDILVRRALENLDGLLNDEGNVILSQYLASVNGVAKQIENAQPGTLLNQAKLFPTPKESPEFAKLWTVRAKGMAVLRMRCTAEVVRLARRRFRQSSPPLYECLRCAATFIIRQEKRHHLRRACPLRRGPASDEVDDDEDDEDGETEDDEQDEVGKRQKSSKGKGSSSSTSKWELRKKAKAKGLKVPEDNADELERDYICWKLAAPIVEAALQPLAVYLTKQRPRPGGTAFVTNKAR